MGRHTVQGINVLMQDDQKAEFLVFMGMCWDFAEHSLGKFGPERQIHKCMEELAEFIAVLAKPEASDESLAEEHADVLIIMSQVTRMASYDEEAWRLLQRAFAAKFAKWKGIVSAA